MRLPKRFYKLPLRFDVERLLTEVAALSPNAWVAHPNREPGNSAVRLISVEGGENDEINGAMQMTPHLAQSPYLRQVLASFGVVWSRSRLLRLAPGAIVPTHSDIHYHWFFRVRLHIPITTLPLVRFTCDGETVHMAAGEAWVFDNWRLHDVANPTAIERIHLVADTSGSASFWELVAAGDKAGTPIRHLNYDPALAAEPRCERSLPRPVMTPGEMDLLLLDLRSELVAEAETGELAGRLSRYHSFLLGFGRDWRQLYALYGEDAAGREPFTTLRDRAREQSRELTTGLLVRTNRSVAHRVFEARILKACLAATAAAATSA
jgi:hypothetical protein